MEHFLLRLIISEYAISLLASIHAMCHWLHQDNHQSRMASVPSETARGMKTVQTKPAIRGEIAPLAMSNRSQFCTRQDQCCLPGNLVSCLVCAWKCRWRTIKCGFLLPVNVVCDRFIRGVGIKAAFEISVIAPS
jgi:hypothetical protein